MPKKSPWIGIGRFFVNSLTRKLGSARARVYNEWLAQSRSRKIRKHFVQVLRSRQIILDKALEEKLLSLTIAYCKEVTRFGRDIPHMGGVENRATVAEHFKHARKAYEIENDITSIIPRSKFYPVMDEIEKLISQKKK